MERTELLDSYYDNNRASERALEKLFQRDGLRDLAELGTGGQVQLIGKRQTHQGSKEQAFEFDYLLTGRGEEIPFTLHVARQWDPDYLRYDWLIGSPQKEEE